MAGPIGPSSPGSVVAISHEHGNGRSAAGNHPTDEGSIPSSSTLGVLWVRGVWVCELAENVGFGSGFSVFALERPFSRVGSRVFVRRVLCCRVLGRVEADGSCRQLRFRAGGG